MCAQFQKPSCSKDACDGKLTNNLVQKLGNCLKPLDDILRCDICFEYFNNCMTTKCGHNYCSLCIRRTLTYKAQCPKCVQQVCESELTNNRLVDDILIAYQQMRDNLDNFTEDDPRYCNPGLNISNLKFDAAFNDKKLTTDNTPNMDDEFSCSSSQIAAKSMMCGNIDDKKVSCPVCCTMIFPNRMNSHLDLCLAAGMTQEETVNVYVIYLIPFTNKFATTVDTALIHINATMKFYAVKRKRKPLPKVKYSNLTDNDIKKDLKNNGLRTTGTRQEMINRHKSFWILYNSDCDSLNPRPVAEIVKQVEKEEMDLKNSATSELFQCDERSHPKVIRREYEQYVEKHAHQFTNLITEIQRRELERENLNKPTKGTSGGFHFEMDYSYQISEDIELNESQKKYTTQQEWVKKYGREEE